MIVCGTLVAGGAKMSQLNTSCLANFLRDTGMSPSHVYYHITMESQISKLLKSKKPSIVNKILCLPGSLYTIIHMLNSKNLTIVKRSGGKTEFF